MVDPFVSNLTRIADLPGDNDNLLEVGETWGFTATHTVTQAEIDAGGTNIVNIATADSNETAPDTDDASVPVTQKPALNIVKDATVPGGTADIGRRSDQLHDHGPEHGQPDADRRDGERSVRVEPDPLADAGRQRQPAGGR